MKKTEQYRKILLVEDDVSLASALRRYLAKFAFDVIIQTDSSQVASTIASENPCCLLLDCMLPNGPDGLEVCRQLRAEGFQVPIIFTTARGELVDRVSGLELGADDYLPKPYDPRELVARIAAVLRRVDAAPGKTHPVLRYDGLTINVVSRTITVDETQRQLSNTEFALLEFLAQHPGEIQDRDTLVRQLKGISWKYGNRSIDVTVSRLRLKLNDPDKNPRFIRTVRSEGYIFIAQPWSIAPCVGSIP